MLNSFNPLFGVFGKIGINGHSFVRRRFETTSFVLVIFQFVKIVESVFNLKSIT